MLKCHAYKGKSIYENLKNSKIAYILKTFQLFGTSGAQNVCGGVVENKPGGNRTMSEEVLIVI